MPVRMNQSTIDRELEDAGRRWGHLVGMAVTNRAKEIIVANDHVDEGRLLGSIDYALTSVTSRGTSLVVGSDVDYAVYFHTGTGIYGPHATPIVPVTRKALKFQYRGAAKGSLPKERGQFMFRRSVAGMEADPFLVTALHDVLGENGTIRNRAA